GVPMRRAALVAVVTAATMLTSSCSLVGGDERRGVPAPAAAPSGPLPTSQQFDRPFPVSAENWDATVTVSNLRFVQSYS
ncbi:hypothetical protein U8M34_28645, partial [Klebsiella pneumoniae]|nr:hypothetical protein [Klebsiella pneumoniae]